MTTTRKDAAGNDISSVSEFTIESAKEFNNPWVVMVDISRLPPEIQNNPIVKDALDNPGKYNWDLSTPLKGKQAGDRDGSLDEDENPIQARQQTPQKKSAIQRLRERGKNRP